MQTPEGLPSLEEAFGLAAVEAGLGDHPEDAAFEAERPADTAPLPDEPEQTLQDTAAPDEPAESVFGDLPEEAAPPSVWDTEVELAGFDRPVKIAEMRDGYLRQSDYTRKTQALAAERKAFEEEHDQALRLMKALTDDPAGTAAYLAVQTGVVDEQTVAGKVRALQGSWKPPPSRDEIEAAVEKRVAEQVANHPAVLQAQQQILVDGIERDFRKIEQQNSIKLTDRDKEAILKRAIDSGTPDLGLVAKAMLRDTEKIRGEREQARGAAGQRPSVRSPSADTPARVNTIEDAYRLALQEVESAG